MAYGSKASIRKTSDGFVYSFEWKNSRICQKECKLCSKPLNFEDMNAHFGIDLGYGMDLTIFASIYWVSKETGISICALRNAYEKANTTIMRRKDKQTYGLLWPGMCVRCRN